MNHREHKEHGGEPPSGLSGVIIGCAIRVHTELGPGLLESTYAECLAHELTLAGVPFEREKAFPVNYRGVLLDCGYRVDFLVANEVVVEIKASETTLPVHEAQVLTYLKLSGCRLGLLTNFNVRRLKDGVRRIAL